MKHCTHVDKIRAAESVMAHTCYICGDSYELMYQMFAIDLRTPDNDHVKICMCDGCFDDQIGKMHNKDIAYCWSV